MFGSTVVSIGSVWMMYLYVVQETKTTRQTRTIPIGFSLMIGSPYGRDECFRPVSSAIDMSGISTVSPHFQCSADCAKVIAKFARKSQNQWMGDAFPMLLAKHESIP